MEDQAKTTKKTSTGVAVNKVQTFDISNSAGIIELAQDLAKFIKENKLSQVVQGKDFVNVEGWQYAGARLGIISVPEYLKDISPEDGSEIVYEAKTNLLNLTTNQIVGSGFAICSNKENGKKYYQQFAIASMAQTRSVGKAYRNSLAWIIRAAGYEPTPSEEMDYAGATEVKVVPQPEKKKTASEPVQDAVVVETKAAKPAMAKADKEKALALIAAGNFAELETLTKTFAISPEEGKKLSKLVEDKKAELKAQAVNSHHPENHAEVAEQIDNEIPVKYATQKQKEEIIRLLNNVVVTRQEKTKMLSNINKLSEDRAAESIQKLRKIIEEREAEANAEAQKTPENQARAAAATELYELATRNSEIIGEKRLKETYALCDTATLEVLTANKEELVSWLADQDAAAA